MISIFGKSRAQREEEERRKEKEREELSELVEVNLVAEFRDRSVCFNCVFHRRGKSDRIGKCMNSANWEISRRYLSAERSIDTPSIGVYAPVEMTASQKCQLFTKREAR